MSDYGMTLWPNGTATLLVDDYRIAVWPSDRTDPEGRITTDWELLRSGECVYNGEGPSSGAHGHGWTDARDGLASLLSFLSAEDERRRYGIAEDDSLFPDATPELLDFIDMHAEDASIVGYDWEASK